MRSFIATILSSCRGERGGGMGTREDDIVKICGKAKAASQEMLSASTAMKNATLEKLAELLEDEKIYIQRENARDIDNGRRNALSAAMLDRLALTDEVIGSMIGGLRQVVALNDPVGAIGSMVRRPNNLMVGRMSVPLGVIAMIYESRPNVTVDAAALCLKAGNSVILRGGSEAIHSNIALARLIQESLRISGLNENGVQVVGNTDREAVALLLKQDAYVDLIIPRGGEGLIRFVSENSTIPVLKHYKGVCHIYVDKEADLGQATPIILNGKVQRPGVCNALEGVLVHEDIAADYLPALTAALQEQGVRILGCEKTCNLSKNVEAARETDWGREFLDLAMIMKVVSGYEEAREYIRTYGSNHTECILTENYSLANAFVREIDASAVMVNTSSRFNDGAQLGLGTEIGISTTKLHAYGPMGLEELTTRKFVVFGEGQVRG